MEINITYEGEKYFSVAVVELNKVIPIQDQIKEYITKLFLKISGRVDINIRQIEYKVKGDNIYAIVTYTYRFK